MSDDGSFVLTDRMTGTLALGADSAAQNALEAFEGMADMVLADAQASAPWDDRTGMARDGLWVEVYEEDGDVYLDLGHSVDYGLYLETIQNGRFATVMPTLERYAAQLFAEAGGAVVSVESGDEYTMTTEA